MKLWQRYIFRKLATTFLFLLGCIFTVYVLVDLSINSVRFFAQGNASELLFYYLRCFAMHLELFLPLSFLLANLKVLFDLNAHFELVALQMAGLSRKKLLVPFFAFAALLSLVSYANSEWLAPSATKTALAFKAASSQHHKKPRREHLEMIALPDHSELVYQTYDPHSETLFDVYWIRTFNDIWHIKTLSIAPPRTGAFVDHLVRHGQLQKTESFDLRLFPELPLTPPKSFVPFESRSISTLFQEALHATSDKASVESHLHYKLALPLLPFLVTLLIAPFATHFARQRPRLLITFLSLFAFIAFFTLFDSLLILGENRVLPAWLALWPPLVFLFALSWRRFVKL